MMTYLSTDTDWTCSSGFSQVALRTHETLYVPFAEAFALCSTKEAEAAQVVL